MRTPKDRLHRVLVIGANPAGLAATNKLGEMGIPVTLVDPEPDLNRKLSNEEWRLTSGLTLNYALRPGLIRILRNPRIRCVLPGEVVSLKHTPQGFSARLKNFQTFTDVEHCSLCGRCAEVCPIADASGSKPIHYNGRQSLPGRPVIDKRRQPLCQENCPLGVNVQGYVALAKAGRYKEALDLIRRDNVLPGICGRVCTHPCENACRRKEIDDPIAIRDIKRFLADNGVSDDRAPQAFQEGSSRHDAKPVAVIGSGPAGLAAAADLARFGHPVTVFEREEKPGGLLRYGIGPYRLPRDVLDDEIVYIKGLGVDFKTSRPVDLPGGLDELREKYAGIVLTTGSCSDRTLGVPGENLDGIERCLELLRRVYRGDIDEITDRVAVIGDGNAAFDLARALVRLKADVTLVSWFPRDLVPADTEEVVAALDEGVNIVDRTQVVGFKGENGRFRTLRCARTEPGEPDEKGIPWPVIVPSEKPFDLEFDRAIVAIGQRGDPERYGAEGGICCSASGFVQVDPMCRTNIPGLYAAGDAVTGPSSVVKAMASGRQAARAVHRDLTGERLPAVLLKRPAERDFPEIAPDIPSVARARMPERQPSMRRESFVEVALGLSEAQVQWETERCLQCGVCSECLECANACRAASILHSAPVEGEIHEHAGVVIIADPRAAPQVKGEDVIRAYSSKALNTDVYSMMVRGFAAAAEAMTLLGGSSQHMKGHGLSFTPPDSQISADVRIGVFVCRCNDVLGWAEELDVFVEELAGKAEIFHAETLPSACSPEGSASILRTLREKGLTRAVLASCVCCPLDFICSACTDQRSRLKDALFNGTGISRATVETCNLRGEVLRLLKEDRALAVERAIGLIGRSISRARHPKTMPSPARPYNFTTAVIGDSEAAFKAAQTLAEAGMEVFLFSTAGKPLPESVTGPNIHHFDGAAIHGLRGTVGNFQIIVEIGGVQQVFQVGAVVLGEHSRKRIPYMPMADLPPRTVESSMQKRGVMGIPFFMPGATSVPGLFLASPSNINISGRIKGSASAIQAASVMPRRPRQNKGYTVVVDETRCRGCGRCMQVCPYQAVRFQKNAVGGWYAIVDEALCKGCGNCIPVCPSNAADSPYRDRRYLEQMIEEILL